MDCPLTGKSLAGSTPLQNSCLFDSEGEQALHVSLGIGSVQFPEVSQIVLLASGKYRLGGKLRGSIIAKRDLR